MTESDRIAFLQAIQANPDDDAAAWIFADWLEEQGELKRAEFLRLEIELANISWDDPRRVALALQRERWSEFRLEGWRRGDLSHFKDSPFYDSGAFEYQKGLVRSLDISNLRYPKKKGVETLQEILEKSAIHELRFPHATAYKSLIEQLAESPVLSKISSLHLLSATHELVNALLRSPYLKQLRSLTCQLSAFPAGNPGGWLDALPLPELRRLRIVIVDQDYGRLIQWGWIGSQLWPSLLKSRRFANLSELDIEGMAIRDKGVRQLAKARRDRDWERLNLSRNSLTDESAHLLAGSRAFAGLRSLGLSRNSIQQEGAFALGDSPILNQLDSLELNHNPIGYNGLLDLLAPRQLPKLARLSVSGVGLRLNYDSPSRERLYVASQKYEREPESGCRVLVMDSNDAYPADIVSFANSPLAARMLELTLSKNVLDDGSLGVLAKSPYLGRLQRLRLRHCRIGRTGAALLAKTALQAMPNLLEADLSQNDIPPKDIPALAADLGPRFRLS